MNLHAELHPSATLSLQASPAMIRLAETLALPGGALDDAVERELAENPALERLAHREPDRPRGAGPCLEDLADSLADDPGDAGRLLGEARLALPASEHRLAEMVIASLDSRGFLAGSDASLAAELGVPPGRVSRVVAAVREAGPPGTAAR